VRSGGPPVESAVGQLLAHRHARPLQGAGHGCDAEFERVGGRRRRPAEDVTKDQHRPLARRQVLDGDDEGQLDALPLLELRLGPRRIDAEQRVGEGLEPGELAGGRGVLGRQQPRRAALEQPQADVRGDAEQPRAQRAAALEAGQAAPGAQ
jgi:hypothetical protein